MMKTFGLLKWACIVSIFGVVTAVPVTAQTYTTLYNFSGPGGNIPTGQLTQGADGNLWGITKNGGVGPCSSEGNPGCGTIFEISTGGALTSLYSFDGSTGYIPAGGLTLATDGNFYGVTTTGGEFNQGAAFQFTPWGDLSDFFGFCMEDCPEGYVLNGADPTTKIIQGTDGNLYGTTPYGGTYCGIRGCGVFFKLTTSPFLGIMTFHSFHSGVGGPTTSVVQGLDGNFYGIAGNFFKITSPTYSLVKFNNPFLIGWPIGGIILGTDGNFYGASIGGSTTYGCGVIYQMTPSGTFTTMYNFTGVNDGCTPESPLIQASDGNFYGLSKGELFFQVTPTGAFTPIYSGVQGTLMQATDGNFYGTDPTGGNCAPYYCGSIFKLSTGLGPFVTTIPTSGKVGTVVSILGYNLLGANVSLNGTPLSSSYIEETELQVTIPAGATTGLMTVGSLQSNKVFRVTPQLKNFSVDRGPVGTVVTINGVSLTQTTQVTFDGVPATFTVDSDLKVTTTVPAGAKSGRLNVTTPGGTVGGLFTVTLATLTSASATYAARKIPRTTSPAQTFALNNNQTVPLNDIAISTTGDFAMSSTTCTTRLPAKSHCNIFVTFTPTATGTRTGQLKRLADSRASSAVSWLLT
jgi:uncharacterized repeat protein (TIGR03803 family)